MRDRSLLAVCLGVSVAIMSTQCGSSGNGGASEDDGGTSSGSGGGTRGGSGGGSGGTSGGGSGGSSGAGSGGGSGGGSGSSSGTGGSSGGGSGSSSGSSSGGTGPVGTSQSVLQRGNDFYRSSTFVEPGLTPAAVKTMQPDTTFDANANNYPANGSTQNQGTASVLYLENGPAQAGCPTGAAGCKATGRAANAGLFFVFPALQSNPNVIALDETTGLPVWTASVTPGSDGIRGTPVIDATARLVYAVTGNGPHVVHAISVDTGVEVKTGGWPITLDSTTGYTPSGGAKIPFNSPNQNQHGALLLVNGTLYIPFGGEYGDGGNYNGWIIAVDTSNPTSVAGWATASSRSGIWGSGGLASDGTYVFGATGDTTLANAPASCTTGTAPSRMTLDSQELVRVKGMAAFSRDEGSVFVPPEWLCWDRPFADLDYGASTPAYVPLPSGSSMAGLLVAPAKAGRVYVLNGGDLSAGTWPSAGGQLADLQVSDTGSESVYTAPTIYTSASGLHAAINVGDHGFNCPGVTGKTADQEVVMSLLLTPGQTQAASIAWCAENSQGGGHTNYPPISTTTDASGSNPVVWFVNGSQLSALDGDTGAPIFTTTGAACSGIPSMSFPIAAKNRIVVAALGHLCSWSPNGQ